MKKTMIALASLAFVLSIETANATSYVHCRKIKTAVAYDDSGCLRDDKKMVEVRNGKQWGLIDENGKLIAPFIYDEIREQYNFATVVKDKKVGIIDEFGTIILPLIYDSAGAVRTSKTRLYLYVSKNGHFGIFDTKGNVLLPPEYDFKSQSTDDQDFLPVSQQGKVVGFFDENRNKLVMPMYYDSVKKYSDIVVVEKNKKFGLVKFPTNQPITPIRYDAIESPQDGLFRVKLDNRYGFIDSKGRIIVSPYLENIDYFNEGLAIVQASGHYGIISKQGKIILPLDYDQIKRGDYGFLWLTKNGKQGLMNEKGSLILPVEYDFIKILDKDRFQVTQNGRTGVIDAKQNSLIKLDYQQLDKRPNEPRFLAKKDNKWGMIDDQGSIEIPLKYDSFEDYGYHLYKVGMNKKYYLLNTETNQILTARGYDDIESMDIENIALIKDNQKYGYIDRDGKEVYPPQFDEANRFRHQQAIVKKDGKYGFIYADPTNPTDINYDEVNPSYYDSYWVKKGDKVGLIDYTGKQLLPVIYDEYVLDYFQLARLKKDNRYALVDTTKRPIVVTDFYDKVEPLSKSIYFDPNSEFLFLLETNHLQGLQGSRAAYIAPQYDKITNYYKINVVQKNGKYGMVDMNNHPIVPLIYDDIQEGGWYSFWLKQDNHWGMFSNEGKQILPIQYTHYVDFKGYHLSVIEKDGKYQLIDDMSGKVFSNRNYDFMDDNFSDGRLLVKLGNKFGYIDDKGNEVIPVQFDNAKAFHYDMAEVEKDGKTFKINTDGSLTKAP